MSSSYPEHEKLRAAKAESQAIGEFLEWLQAVDGGDSVICERTPDDDDRFFMKNIDTNQLLANYFGINLHLIEKEKLLMLAELREDSSNNTPLQRAHQRGLAQEGTE